jgi:hypothetical protein
MNLKPALVVAALALAALAPSCARVTPHECEHIATRCHAHDGDGGTPAECHQNAHDVWSAAECTANEARCFAACPETDGGHHP